MTLNPTPQDYALPQVQCGLRVDPIALMLSPAVVQLLLDALQPLAAAPLPSPTAAAAVEAATPGACATPAADASPAMAPPAAALPPSPFADGGGSGGGGGGAPGGPATAPVLDLDLQLGGLDLRFSGGAASAGPGAGASSSGRSEHSALAQGPLAPLAALEARLTCAGTSVSVQSLLDGLAVQVRLALARGAGAGLAGVMHAPENAFSRFGRCW